MRPRIILFSSLTNRSAVLTLWFQRKVKGQGARARRIGIVALARKLLVALWRYVEHGLLPEGAVMKSAGAH